MLNRTVAILLLLITLLPLMIFLYAYSIVTTAPFADGNFDTLQSLIIPNVIITALLILGYIIFIAKTNRVPKDKQMLWIIAIIVFHVLAMPVFWFHYIWKQPVYGSVSFQAE